MKSSIDVEKHFLMQHPSILHRDITILGDGDFDKGWSLLAHIVSRLNYAREKHKWGKGQEIDSHKKALAALYSEIGEWIIANRENEIFADKEHEQSVIDEALDIIAVSIRIAAREWEC